MKAGNLVKNHLKSFKIVHGNNDVQDSMNPFKVCRNITFLGFLQFFSAFFCWVMVSLSVTALQEVYDKDSNDITTSITLTLLLRPVGAIVTGLLSDKFGRKWVLVTTMAIVGALSISTCYCETFSSFLAVRSLFGIAMGGIWGPAAAIGLESLPTEARGLFSGIFQQGYAIGYLIAACVNLGFVPGLPDDVGYRGLFYLGAGLSWAAGIIRAILPESKMYIEASKRKQEQIASGDYQQVSSKVFAIEFFKMLKNYWIVSLFAFWLMTLFNFFSHASQDFYPTTMEQAKCQTKHSADLATIVSNVGAVVGGIISGGLSQKLGRRLTIILFAIFAGAFIPLWIIPSDWSSLAAGAFFVQFGVQGAWGCIPAYLNEIAPGSYRSLFGGLAYQLGNMVSSASSQIISVAGGTRIVNGCGDEPIKDYATVSGIFVGIIAALIMITAFCGKENKNKHIEESRTAGEAGAGDNESDVLGPLENFDQEKGLRKFNTNSIYSSDKASSMHREYSNH